MTAQILDGKATAATIRRELAERVAKLAAGGTRPGLGTVLAETGDRPWHMPPRTPAGVLRIGYMSAFFDRANYMKPVWGLTRLIGMMQSASSASRSK